MRVENNRYSEMLFENLELGDCFEYGCDFFIKTNNITAKEGAKWNAVYLKSGLLTWFSDAEEVRYTDAKIVVD